MVEEVAADPAMQRRWELGPSLLAVFLAMAAIYGALFGTGFWLYGNLGPAVTATITAIIAAVMLVGVWKKVT